MCGIIGIYGSTESYSAERITSALKTIKERGPDANGFVKREKVILGHSRLSIIDLSTGSQPMKDSEKNIYLSFNGEIYNFLELKKDLIEHGHTFDTTSDTETIIKAYKQYGESFVKRLDGMFAFILYDEDKDILIMARDRFGKKPLYMVREENKLIVASRIETLKSLSSKKLTISNYALDSYLQFGYVIEPKTIYNEVDLLPKASYLIIQNGKEKILKYWDIRETHKIEPTFEEAKETVRKLLENAVSKRMFADVPVGSLLSGGVDSSLVSILASKETKERLKTFSIKYGNSIDETEYSKEVSKKINSDHKVLDASDRDIVTELRKINKYIDSPIADSSLFPQHIISELASKDVKVALSGDGADELAMGYGWYTKWNNLSKLTWLKTRLFSNQFKEYLKYISIFNDKERTGIWKDKAVYDIGDIFERNGTGVESINNFDINIYLPSQLLTKIDRTSMMHSLEVRSPFLDTKLAEYLYSLPTEFKMKDNKNKIVIKNILSEIMPEDFVYRRKQGFGAPIVEWLNRAEVKEELFRLVDIDNQLWTIWNKDKIQDIIDAFYKGKNNSLKVWAIFNLLVWLSSRK